MPFERSARIELVSERASGPPVEVTAEVAFAPAGKAPDEGRRTGGYRLMLTDAYAYRQSIDYTIEHGPEKNSVPTDYTSVVFFYSLDPPPPAPPLPPVAGRRVADPTRVVFVPGWNVPIHTSSLRNATLSKRTAKVGDRQVRYLSLESTGDDVFGAHHVSLVCDLPAAGRYTVGVKAVVGPDQGILRVFRNDLPAGEPANLYAPERSVSEVLPLGTFEMDAGPNTVFLYLTGKDARSAGTNLELIEIVFERR